MKAIYITGFMGAGKSTVGKKLAETLHLPVIDTDNWIEDKIGKKIKDIFSEEGEDAFRRYEEYCLKSLPTENIIITTGGGIVVKEINRKWMKQNGMIVYLHCMPEEIFERLQSDTSRPLLAQNKKENIKKLFSQRLAFYLEADIQIDTTKKHVDEIVQEMIDLMYKETNKG